MYSPDTLKRLNDEAVAAHQANLADQVCDFCDEPAVEVIPVYNPADALRDPPVEGAYTTLTRCETHREEGYMDDETFICPGCGEYFIVNHSWDVVAVMTDDGWYCQKCAADDLEGMELIDVLVGISNGNTEGWTRINRVPDKKVFFEGEFAPYPDFPGYNTWASLHDAIEKAAEEAGIGKYDTVYPIIDHGYQFSVSLAIYH